MVRISLLVVLAAVASVVVADLFDCDWCDDDDDDWFENYFCDLFCEDETTPCPTTSSITTASVSTAPSPNGNGNGMSPTTVSPSNGNGNGNGMSPTTASPSNGNGEMPLNNGDMDTADEE